MPYFTVLDYERFPTRDYRNNWCSLVTANLGVAATALLGDDPRASVWLHRIATELFTLLDHLPRDGGWSEGLSYWEYAVESLLVFAEVLRSVTDGEIDPFRHPFWAKTGDFVLYNWLPPGGWVNFSDAQQAPNDRALLVRLGEEANRPDWMWLGGKLPFRGQPKELMHWVPRAAGQRPSHGRPLAVAFPEVGWATMRSGWDDDAVVFALRSGYKDPHSHLDLNTFILHAFGETLIRDLPIAHYPAGYFGREGKTKQHWSATQGHNTILVNQAEQRSDLSSRGYIREFLYGGPGTDVAASTVGSVAGETQGRVPRAIGCDYVLSDASEVYRAPVTRALRHVLYLRDVGEDTERAKTGCFLMVDEVSAESPAEFEWRVHPGGRVHVGQEYLSIVGQQAGLALFPLSPTEWRARQGEHADGASYLSLTPRQRTTSTLVATLLVPVRLREARAIGEGPFAIPRDSLPEVVVLPQPAGLDLYVNWQDLAHLVTIRVQDAGAASLGLVTQERSGRVVGCGLFGAREVCCGPRQVAASDAPVTGVFWVDGNTVCGRVTGRGEVQELNLSIGAKPTSTNPGGQWEPGGRTLRLHVPPAEGAVPVRLERAAGLG